jgi:hypothetical protein
MGPPYPGGVEQCGPNGSVADLPVLRQHNWPRRPRCAGSARPSSARVGAASGRDNRGSTYARRCNTMTRGSSDARADFLDRRHERVGKQHRPPDAEPKLCAGLAVCPDEWISRPYGHHVRLCNFTAIGGTRMRVAANINSEQPTRGNVTSRSAWTVAQPEDQQKSAHRVRRYADRPTGAMLPLISSSVFPFVSTPTNHSAIAAIKKVSAKVCST